MNAYELIGRMLHDAVNRSPIHARYTVADFDRLIISPVRFGQVYVHSEYGWATWANLSEEAEQRLLNLKLLSSDFASGDFSRIWIVDMISYDNHILPLGREITKYLLEKAKREGWPARKCRWMRTFGTGKVVKLGEVDASGKFSESDHLL